MNWKSTTSKVNHRNKQRKKKRKSKNNYMMGGFWGMPIRYGFGPVFPCGGNFDMSSVPGGPDGAGDPGMGMVGEAIDKSSDKKAVDSMMLSDDDRLAYALRGIIENAKMAYEAVTGTPYDESDEFDDSEDDSDDDSDENYNDSDDDDEEHE